MKNLISNCIKFITGEWEIFYIYKKKLCSANEYTYNDLTQYIQKEMTDKYYKLSICENGEEICSLCVIWGNEYKDNFRNYIPLKPNEAKVIDVVTSQKHRGRGHIGKLLVYTEQVMLSKGVDTLLARIWHSNHSSKRAFEKNNWNYAGFKLKLNIFKKIPVTYMTYK